MDIQILLWLQQFREAVGGCFNGFCTLLATISVDYYVFIPLLIVYWIVDKKKGLLGLGSFGLACWGNAFTKAAFCVYRPAVRDPRVKPLDSVLSSATGYSFPSGHATSASALYGSMMVAFKKQKLLRILFTAMIVLVMLSRMYVGVHTIQDVLAGTALGLLSVLIVSLSQKFVENNPEKDWIVLAAAVLLCIVIVPYVYFKPYPMDYVNGELLVDPVKKTIGCFTDAGRLLGVAVGWFLERRFVKFEVECSSREKFLRAFLGGLLFVLYWTIVLDWLSKMIGTGWIQLLLHASAPALFMCVYPLCFKWLKSRA